MKRIYKYLIPVEEQIALNLPRGSEILTVQMQKSEPCIWALVDTAQPREERYFYLYGTGFEVRSGLKYIGTFQMPYAGLVFHLFEV